MFLLDAYTRLSTAFSFSPLSSPQRCFAVTHPLQFSSFDFIILPFIFRLFWKRVLRSPSNNSLSSIKRRNEFFLIFELNQSRI